MTTRKLFVIAMTMFLCGIGVAKAAETNALLTPSEIVQQRKNITNGNALVAKRTKEWCRADIQNSAALVKACQIQYNWIVSMGDALLKQLDSMENIASLPASPQKDQLSLTMNADRYRAELKMLLYRVDLVTLTFDPEYRQALAKTK